MKNEPVLTALVASLLALGVSFGLPVTDAQQTAIMAVVVIVAGLVTRSKVTPS